MTAFGPDRHLQFLLEFGSPSSCDNPKADSIKAKQRRAPKHGMSKSFPSQVHRMLEDAEVEGFQHIVSWLPCGTGLKVHSRKEFVKSGIISRYFKQTRYKSFQKQLNIYRFHRTPDGEQKGAYSHPLLFRGRRDLCNMIMIPSDHRQKKFRKTKKSKNAEKGDYSLFTAEGCRGGGSTPCAGEVSEPASFFLATPGKLLADLEPCTTRKYSMRDDIADEIILTFCSTSKHSKQDALGGDHDVQRLFDDEF